MKRPCASETEAVWLVSYGIQTYQLSCRRCRSFTSEEEKDDEIAFLQISTPDSGLLEQGWDIMF